MTPFFISKRSAAFVIAAFMWGAVITVFSFRAVPTSLDDQNYIAYFDSSATPHEVSSNFLVTGYEYILNEPLWATYTYLVRKLFSPEDCIRFTIALSLLLLAVASFSSGRPLFFLILYALTPELLFNVNYTQIRQGLALGIFVITMQTKRNIKLSALIASLVHSSFLLFLIAALVRETRSIGRAVIIVAITIGMAVFLYNQVGLVGLLGRRDYYESFVDKLNFNFYLVNIVLLLYVFFLGRWYSRPGVNNRPQVEMLETSFLNSVGALVFGIMVIPIDGRFLINSDVAQIYALSDRRLVRGVLVWLAVIGVGCLHAYQLFKYSQQGMDFFSTFHSLL